jgi:acyl dehydratase
MSIGRLRGCGNVVGMRVKRTIAAGFAAFAISGGMIAGEATPNSACASRSVGGALLTQGARPGSARLRWTAPPAADRSA